MQKRLITAKPAKPAKPVALVATQAKPAAVAAKPVVPATPAIAKPPAHIARTAATVARGVTNFAELSDRDGAYFTFYKRLILANAGKLTLGVIVASGSRPAYNGSNKPHDAGAIVRLTKAGLITGHGTDASPLVLTARGSASK